MCLSCCFTPGIMSNSYTVNWYFAHCVFIVYLLTFTTQCNKRDTNREESFMQRLHWLFRLTFMHPVNIRLYTLMYLSRVPCMEKLPFSSSEKRLFRNCSENKWPLADTLLLLLFFVQCSALNSISCIHMLWNSYTGLLKPLL